MATLEHPLLRDVLELRQTKGMGPFGRLLLEGLRLVRTAVGANLKFELLLHAPEFYSEDCEALVERVAARGVPTLRLDPRAFSKLSYKAEGLVGLVRYTAPAATALRLDRVLVLDALSDPGNIGSAIRSANAWRVDAVIVVESGQRLYHPKSLRASMGALFDTPTCALNRAAAIELAVASNAPVLALVPGGSTPITNAIGDRWVIVIGNEKRGVHADWLGPATVQASIPMGGVIDSLNAATAASVTLWEAFRSRR